MHACPTQFNRWMWCTWHDPTLFCIDPCRVSCIQGCWRKWVMRRTWWGSSYVSSQFIPTYLFPVVNVFWWETQRLLNSIHACLIQGLPHWSPWSPATGTYHAWQWHLKHFNWENHVTKSHASNITQWMLHGNPVKTRCCRVVAKDLKLDGPVKPTSKEKNNRRSGRNGGGAKTPKAKGSKGKPKGRKSNRSKGTPSKKERVPRQSRSAPSAEPVAPESAKSTRKRTRKA